MTLSQQAQVRPADWRMLIQESLSANFSEVYYDL